jgi:transposase
MRSEANQEEVSESLSNSKVQKINWYKAKLEGIEVIIINESFTSGCSALDLESLNRSDYDKSRRVERGLFVSNKGIKINSDVNGSLNIMRKYLKDNSIPKLISRARDNGSVDQPERIRVA